MLKLIVLSDTNLGCNISKKAPYSIPNMHLLGANEAQILMNFFFCSVHLIFQWLFKNF